MPASPIDQGKRVIEGNRVPCGYQQISGLSSAKGLTVPDSGARFALIQAQDKDVRWRDDGTSPTASIGMVLQANGYLEYTGDLSAFKAIETEASAVVNVSYYK